MKTIGKLLAVKIAMAALLLVAFSCFAPAAQAQAVAAAPGALKLVPEDALGFVIVNRLSDVDKNVGKLAAALQLPPMPGPIAQGKMAAGIQAGLDENGSAVVAFLPREAAAGSTGGTPEKPHEVFVFIPVTDYAKFIGQFQPEDATAEITTVTIHGEKSAVGHKDAYAVFAEPDRKERLAQVLASTKSVESIIAPLAPWMAKHDASAVVTPAGLKQMTQQARAGLKKAAAALAATQQAGGQGAAPGQAAAALAMYDSLLKRVGNEVQEIAVGTRVDDGGNMFLDSRWAFVPGHKLSEAMKGIEPSQVSLLAGLPGGTFVFAGEGVLPESWADALVKLSMTSLEQLAAAPGGTPIDPEARKKYAAAMRDSMKGIKSVAFVMAPNKPGEPIFGRTIKLIKVDNSATFLDHYQQAMEQFGELYKTQKDPPFKFEGVKKLDIDGHASLELTMDMSGTVGAQPQGVIVGKIISAVFGGTKFTAYMVALDEHTVVATYGDENRAKEAAASVKNPQPSVAADADLGTTAKLLPQDAPWVGFLNIRGTWDLIRNVIASVAPPGAVPPLPDFPVTAPIGFAAQASPEGFETTMVITKETFTAIGGFIKQVQPTFGGGRPGQPGQPGQ